MDNELSFLFSLVTGTGSRGDLGGSYMDMPLNHRLFLAQFDTIRAHSCDIESRLDDSYCTADWLKAENHSVTEGFQSAGEAVTLIDTDWETAVETLMQEVV